MAFNLQSIYRSDAELINESVVASADFYTSDLSVKCTGQSILTIQVEPDTDGVLTVSRTKDTDVVTSTLGAASGGCTAGGAFAYPYIVPEGWTFNLSYSVNATVSVIVIESGGVY